MSVAVPSPPREDVSSWKERLPLAAMTPFTLQDFPGKTACILWFSGCQMRCRYCHNPDFALGRGDRLQVEDVLAFLERRRGLLDGVVFSGGECLLSAAVLPLLRAVRELGYAIKVDTNGASCSRLEAALGDSLIDYVALDFKAPFDTYAAVTGWSAVDDWKRSFALLQASAVSFELRTTVHTDLVDEAQVTEMFDWLETQGFCGTIYIQNFRESVGNLGKLGAPKRRFDIAALLRQNRNRRFVIRTRNFTEYECSAGLSGA